MKVRYHYENGRREKLFREHEVTMSINDKTGQVYFCYPEPANVYADKKGYLGSYIMGKSGSWQIVRESMTQDERLMYGKALRYWRNKLHEEIRRNNANPCFPKHLGPVSDTVNGIGGTYHTLHCKACGSTWHVDSGD
jgi:hypothetical protein